MAITKVMHMKASNNGQIDIHLKQAIAYIINPAKLGSTNLVGGINCLPENAYELMRATKEMFQKTGGRQGYHFVISLKPGEGTPEQMYDIAMQFAEHLLREEYEAIVAIHTDKEHLHAHIVLNSVNMVTGHKFQYHNGDWKSILQPITNKLCKEYGLDIIPAEYSNDSKNMSRPNWEREQSFNTLIKDDVNYCALLAEDERHFTYLLTHLGYDVKNGMHISVKAPGMKRFKRIDTISEDFSKENLNSIFRYSVTHKAYPKAYTLNPIYVKRAKLSTYQKKYYARMYRLRLIEKNRFTYKSATYYQAIRQMHQLQEEYLLIVNHNIHSFTELLNVSSSLQEQLNRLTEQQKGLYAKRGVEKRSCKSPVAFKTFREEEASYRQKLEAIKKKKSSLKDEVKILDRCYKKEISLLEERFEKDFPVGDMPDIENIYDVEVPENPYKETTLIQQDCEKHIFNYPNETHAEIRADNYDTIISEELAQNSSIEPSIPPVKPSLPLSRDEYLQLSIEEKAKRYPFDTLTENEVFTYVANYLKSIGIEANFSELFDEYEAVYKYYTEVQETLELDRNIDLVLNKLAAVGMNAKSFINADSNLIATVFPFEKIDYSTGLKLYRGVLDKLQIHIEFEKIYDEFDRVYAVSSVKDKKTKELKR